MRRFRAATQRAWDLGRATLRGARRDRVTGLAAEVAFYWMLALPSSLLALFASMAYITDRLAPGTTRRIAERLLDSATALLSADGVDTLRALVDSVLTATRTGLFIASVIVAVISASRATAVFVETVRVAYGQSERRPWLRRRLVAIGVTSLGVVASLVILPLLALGPRFGTWLAERTDVAGVEIAWSIVYLPAVAVGGGLLLASFYHLAAPVRTPWRRDLPGAVFALAAWAVAAFGLRLYTLFSVERSPVQGTVGGLVVLMLLLYATSLALLLGAELNGELDRRARENPDLADAPG